MSSGLDLNNINKTFYETCAKYWNNNPDFEWRGWVELPQYFPKGNFSVLDLGAGSGRFGHFLDRQCPERVSQYTAVDFAQFYIDTIKSNPLKIIRSQTTLHKDLFSGEWEGVPPSDLIVAFGLIHHLPIDLRKHFFTSLRAVFKSTSIGIITTWQYLDNQRISKKITPSKYELEEGGNILNWTKGEYGERYSHHWSIQEVIEVGKEYGFKVTYLPSPSELEGNLNNYFLFSLS